MRVTVRHGFLDFSLRRRPRRAAAGSGEESRIERPLRSELLSVDQLKQHARALAGLHESDERPGPDRLLSRLAENESALLAAYESIAEAVRLGRRTAPAADWLLDNFYLIEEQIRIARRHLPRKYSGELPRLRNGPLAGYPRVYAIALELVSHGDGRVDAENLSGFVASYQSVTTLKLGELWAVPIMLRLALIENLRRVAVRISAYRRDRDAANAWADRMLDVAEKEPGNLVLVLADMVREDPPLTSAFVAEFVQRLRGQHPAMTLPIGWLEQRLAESNHTVEGLIHQEAQNQAADQISISNTIGSLRFLSAMDWREFVETMSAVEHVLRGEPAGVYGRMDFTSRDQYRHVVEDVARRSPLPEDEVARRAVQLARDRIAHIGGDERTAHVGYYLVGMGRPLLEHAVGAQPTIAVLLRRVGRYCPLFLYVGAVVVVTVLATAAGLLLARRYHPGLWGLLAFGLPLLLAASHLSVLLVNWIAALLVDPRPLPRLDFSRGIPPDHRTAVVVPALLTSRQGVEDLLESLELRFLANRDPHLHFVLLTDLCDAPRETLPEDEEIVRLAKEGIESLNRKYEAERDDAFFLLHRPRKWNKQEGVWMGWERKRGKLAEFNAFLRNRGGGAFSVIVGRTEVLSTVRYVITLDADTQLPRDTARQLVGAMAHPLNRPRYDPALKRVVDGYGILQPRVGISLPSAARSRFARLFAADAGIDPYTRTVSDIYQDVFGEGSYVGKGIYDVDAFDRSVGHCFPENRILSHDLLEGCHARSGLVSDVVLLEDHPSSYVADMRRRHRWIRGDWQIAPWVLPRVPGPDARRTTNPLTALSRWKIFDNLRRSLVPVALATLLFVGWALPGPPLFYTLVVVTILGSPTVFAGLTELLRRSPELPWALRLKGIGGSAARHAAQAGISLIFLPYEAWVSLDAVLRVAVRVLFTRRGLLEWQTARDADQNARTGLAAFWTTMWVAPWVAIVAATLVALRRPGVLTAVGPVLALWFVSPAVAWWLSLPVRVRAPRLKAEDTAFLRGVARRTWRFFETFVGPADHYLPPDNYQEHLTGAVAHRTSPTNMGLSLLANLAAWDFGYISIGRLIERTSQTLSTMGRLERYHGHFYNWYDTRTLRPLAPLYVSSVDSGNLVGHLLTLACGLTEVGDQKIVPPRTFEGLWDTLRILLDLVHGRSQHPGGAPVAGVSPEIVGRLEQLQKELEVLPRTLAASHGLLERLAAAGADLATLLSARPDDELKWWAHALGRQSRDFLNDLLALAPWCKLPPAGELLWRRGSVAQVQRLTDLRNVLRALDDIPTLRDVTKLSSRMLAPIDEILADLRSQRPGAPTAEHEWFELLREAIVEASRSAQQRIDMLEELAARCRELSDVRWDILYDKTRHLLSIGYNVTYHRLDAGHYDLLASEARLGSFVAIARGELPQEHWFRLGRSLTRVDGRRPLLSWSGSMFEYLMPLLVMPTFENTLLDDTCRAVVACQIEYGRRRNVPWGMSESGYNATDVHLNYQYRTFGVPGLGFRRGLADDLVVAPYASALALMIAPEAASANLRRLHEEGAFGAYGFYEAIDYTPSRVPRGPRGTRDGV